MEILCITLIICLCVVVIYRQQFYKSLYQDFTDGISIISENKIIDCNDTLVKLFGYDNKKEFLSVHPLNLTPAFQPDNSLSCDKAQEMMDIVEKTGKCKFDWVFLDKEQNEKWIEIDIVKLKKTFFSKQKFCMVWRDIDLRVSVQKKLENFNSNLEDIVHQEIKKNKEKEKQLVKQSKLAQLGEMISMIAHQWRQPLAIVSSSVIDLQMKMVLQKNDTKLLSYVEKHLADTESCIASLTETIDDFRNFYKPTKSMQQTDLSLIVTKAYAMIESYFKTCNIEILFDDKSSKKITAFENELIQVCLNILQNSRENFLVKEIEKSQIIISTTDIEDGVSLSICDNGGGVTPDIIDKMFDPYFSTKYEKNGTGLGLYMCLKIVKEHHNGTITAANTKDGICFSILLQN